MARLFHSFITRDPAKLSQLRNPEAIMRVAILERISANEAYQDIYSERTFPAHLRAVHDQCEGSSSLSRSDLVSRQPSGQRTLQLHAIESTVYYSTTGNVNLIQDDVFLDNLESLLPVPTVDSDPISDAVIVNHKAINSLSRHF